MRFKNIIPFIILLFLFSCKNENRCDCIKSTGKQVITERNLANFNCIVTNSKIDVFITQGLQYEVKVEAGANLQSLIKTELDGETLKVVNKNRCNWVRDYDRKINIYITAPYFKYLENNGLGIIQSTAVLTQPDLNCRATNTGDIKLQVNTNTLSGSANGNGSLYISGNTNQFNYDFVGTNYLYAADLTISQYLYLHSVTIGKAFIKAPENGTMDIILDQSGNVFYTGNPATIHLTKNSTGDLIKQ